jgi:hypothetical protein
MRMTSSSGAQLAGFEQQRCHLSPAPDLWLDLFLLRIAPVALPSPAQRTLLNFGVELT